MKMKIVQITAENGGANVLSFASEEEMIEYIYPDVYGVDTDLETYVTVYYHNRKGKRMRETLKRNTPDEVRDLYEAFVRVMEKGE